MNLTRLEANLREVQAKISQAALRSGRTNSDVTLVAVTKKAPLESVRALVKFGAQTLGENYPQELWSKAEALADLHPNWHHIGHLQGNKAKRTIPVVKFFHGVDSLKLLLGLDELVGTLKLESPPGVCLQVNTSGEASKHGWNPEQIFGDVDAIADVRHVPVVGLMTMAKLGTEGETARPYFAALREIRDRLAEKLGRPLPALSMGMTSDYEAAILEGSTHVRVGSALFEGVLE